MAITPYHFGVNKVLVHNCRSKGDHNDSDWLQMVVTINEQVHSGTFNIGENIHAGDELPGPWQLGPLMVDDGDSVTVSLVVNNNSHTDAAEQEGEAIKIGTLIVAAVGGYASAASKTPALAKLNAAIAGVIGGLGEVLGWIVGESDPNCNGEVLTALFGYGPGELVRRVPISATNEYTARSPSECGNDPHTTLTFTVAAGGFFPLPGAAVFDRTTQQVAAVSRAPGNLDLFVVGFDSHVWTQFWNDKSGWNSDWVPLPGQAVFDHEHQQLAAVSRAPGNLDLFVVGFDSHVWTQFWNDKSGWNSDWVPLPGQAVFDHEHQQLAAVSRAPGNLDLFVVGFDSHVWTQFWNDKSGWNSDWVPLPGQAVFDHEHQQLAAVSRAPGNLDLFVVGFDSHVWTQFWNDKSGWNSDWVPLPGQAVFDHEHQQLAAVSRAPGNLDLFVIGFDSHVWSTFWNEQLGWDRNSDGSVNPNGHFFPLPGTAVFDHEHQQLAAVSRAPGNLDVFVIGFDSHVWSTFWNEQLGWDRNSDGSVNPNGHFFPLPGTAVFDHEHQQLAAVSRAPGNLDVFVIGFDSHVWSEFWNDGVGWN